MSGSLRKIIGKIHLWLGLATGLVVFIVAITGCIYTFEQEITSLYDDYKYVEPQEASFIPPSKAQEIAQDIVPGRHVHGAIYGDKNEALQIVYYEADPEFYQKAYVNPYSGELIKVVDLESGFFHFILDGHLNLWMGEFGNKIVSYGTLIFLFILISGLILWWPRNKKVAKKRMKFSWADRTRWKRKNYDLHNILGFYASAIALIIAITGLIMTFNWFANGVYTLTGGDKTPTFSFPKNVSEANQEAVAAEPIDVIWKRMKQEYPQATSIEMHYPPSDEYTVYAYMKFSEGTYWDADYRYFDSRTLEEVDPGHVYGDIEKASTADMIQRMNYDIHVGAIGGIAGKIIAFLSSLIVGSLPVTGTIIWWGRRKSSKKARIRRKQSDPAKIDTAA
jgi:uncharacterized iron-regulated membrane protein